MGKRFNIKRVYMYVCDYCDKFIPIGELMPHLKLCAENYTGEFNIDLSRTDILLYLFGIKRNLNPKITFNNELDYFSLIIYRTIFDLRRTADNLFTEPEKFDLLSYKDDNNYNKLYQMENTIMESYLECPYSWSVPIINHLKSEIDSKFGNHLWGKDPDFVINEYYQLYSEMFIFDPDLFKKADGLVYNFPYHHHSPGIEDQYDVV